MPLATCHIVGKWEQDNDTPSTGSVTLVRSGRVRETSTKVIIEPDPVTVRLDNMGAIALDVIATDIATLDPQSITYTVTESIDNLTAVTYSIQAPAGTTVDLALVAPVSPAGTVSSFVTQSQLTADLATKFDTAGTGLTATGTTVAADFGTGAGKVTQGNDSRLTDARTPTAHAASHNAGGSDALAADAAAGTASLRTLGTGAQQAAAGNDSRLSDARTPTGGAGGVLSGTYPNPGFAVDMATQAELNTAIAAAVNDGDTAGGVLAGTYPNPSFAGSSPPDASKFLDGTGVFSVPAGQVASVNGDTGAVILTAADVNAVDAFNGGGEGLVVATIGAAYTFDLSGGNHFELTSTTSATTFTLPSGLGAGRCRSFTARIIEDATTGTYGWTWPSSATLTWVGSGTTAPTRTTGVGQWDLVSFFTTDGGAHWIGSHVSGQPPITVSTTAPSSPVVNQLWVDTT